MTEMRVGPIFEMVEQLRLDDLRRLNERVQMAIETQSRRNREEAIESLKKMASEFGYDLSELLREEFKQENDKSKSTSGVKYAHPKNHELTWSGRGRQPHWFKALVRGGVDPQSLVKSD